MRIRTQMTDKALELRNVSVVRDGRRILDRVSLDISAGYMGRMQPLLLSLLH